MMADAVLTFSRLDVDEALVEDFVKHIDYFKGDISNPSVSSIANAVGDFSRYRKIGCITFRLSRFI